MIRKLLLVLTLALGLAASGTIASAQAPGAFPPELLAAWKKEAPLAQKDLDTYVKMMPELPKAGNDAAAIAKLYEGYGLNETRFSFISVKIGLGMALGAGATPEQIGMAQIPEVLRPTEADVTLVKKNMNALQQAAMAMGQQAPPKK